MNVSDVGTRKWWWRGLLLKGFGVLSLASGETEVELGNDECSGHILNRWHK
jgi:hypothetical protein